jgi:predicted amidophosphoribosyltransferase
MLTICPNCKEETEGRYNLCDCCGEELKRREPEELDLDKFEDDEDDIDAIELEI